MQIKYCINVTVCLECLYIWIWLTEKLNKFSWTVQQLCSAKSICSFSFIILDLVKRRFGPGIEHTCAVFLSGLSLFKTQNCVLRCFQNTFGHLRKHLCREYFEKGSGGWVRICWWFSWQDHQEGTVHNRGYVLEEHDHGNKSKGDELEEDKLT